MDGQTYYAHAGTTKLGKPSFFMGSAAAGALFRIPDGFEVVESINAVFSLRRKAPLAIPDADLKRGRDKVSAFAHLKGYRVGVQGAFIVIYRPIGLDGIKALQRSDQFSTLKQLDPIVQMLGKDPKEFFEKMAKEAGLSLSDLRRMDRETAQQKRDHAASQLLGNLQYEGVLRFKRDRRSSEYIAERRTYRGITEWITIGYGPIDKLAGKFIKHVGKESFFDLI